MPVARILQWPFRVMPLLSTEILQEKWQVVLPLISRSTAVARIRETAMEISECGDLSIDRGEQHIGFFRLWVSKTGYSQKRSWCVDIWHGVHFTGRWESVPNLEYAKRIRFKALTTPHPGGKLTELGSYLTIEDVR